MTDDNQELRRADTRERTRRDIARLEGREPAGRFWRSLGLVGSVGWPIVVLATGGALLGRYLDARWHTGIRLTGTLLTVGTVVGATIAWHSVRSNGP